jgi:hypothetical protein
MVHLTPVASAFASLALFSGVALATPQWSTDPAANLAVADPSGDQVQPKIAPTSDNGCYISWFDSIANGFDLRLQKLDADGNEQWAHNGILVLDRGFSSTQDYGLDVDAAGNALLTCRDDSGTGVQISAAKVSPTGALLWGAGGVSLTNTSNFVAAPKIAGTSDGSAVIAWTENSLVRLQKLDGAGAPQWGTGLSQSPSAGGYSVADLHDHGTTVILSMVHQTGSQFWSPKHLVAMKFDGSGSSLWGANPLSIFDSGSLQIGNFPSFIPDGSGGAVFACMGPVPSRSTPSTSCREGAKPSPTTESAAQPTRRKSAQTRLFPMTQPAARPICFGQNKTPVSPSMASAAKHLTAQECGNGATKG